MCFYGKCIFIMYHNHKIPYSLYTVLSRHESSFVYVVCVSLISQTERLICPAAAAVGHSFQL